MRNKTYSHRNKLFFFALFILFAQAACRPKSDTSVVARVNGDSISVEEFKSRLSEYLVGTPEHLGPLPEDLVIRKNVLNELIEERVLLQEADRMKIEIASEDVEAHVKQTEKDYTGRAFEDFLHQQHMSRSRYKERIRIRLTLEALEREVTKSAQPPAANTIQKYYQDHGEAFRKGAEVNLQQIVVKTEEDAKNALEQIKNNVPFEEVARKLSFMPEAEKGGLIGWINLSSLPKELASQCAKVALQKVSEPIQTEYGFHVIKVLDRHPEKMLKPEEAAPEITRLLLEQEKEKLFSNYRKDVLSKIHVERNHALLSHLR